MLRPPASSLVRICRSSRQHGAGCGRAPTPSSAWNFSAICTGTAWLAKSVDNQETVRFSSAVSSVATAPQVSTSSNTSHLITYCRRVPSCCIPILAISATARSPANRWTSGASACVNGLRISRSVYSGCRYTARGLNSSAFNRDGHVDDKLKSPLHSERRKIFVAQDWSQLRLNLLP